MVVEWKRTYLTYFCSNFLFILEQRTRGRKIGRYTEISQLDWHIFNIFITPRSKSDTLIDENICIEELEKSSKFSKKNKRKKKTRGKTFPFVSQFFFYYYLFYNNIMLVIFFLKKFSLLKKTYKREVVWYLFIFCFIRNLFVKNFFLFYDLAFEVSSISGQILMMRKVKF